MEGVGFTGGCGEHTRLVICTVCIVCDVCNEISSVKVVAVYLSFVAVTLS